MALDTLDYDHTVHQRKYAGDDALAVKFYTAPMEDQVASKQEGRPIFKPTEWIDIRVPGSRDSRIRKVRPADIERFPQHYAAFKNRTAKDEEDVIGTPLEVWPVVSSSQVQELRFFNIKTVEHLASAPDNLGQKFMGFQNLKTQAAAFIKAASETAPIMALQERVGQLETQNKNLMNELKEVLAEAKEEKAARRARRLAKQKE